MDQNWYYSLLWHYYLRVNLCTKRMCIYPFCIFFVEFVTFSSVMIICPFLRAIFLKFLKFKKKAMIINFTSIWTAFWPTSWIDISLVSCGVLCFLKVAVLIKIAVTLTNYLYLPWSWILDLCPKSWKCPVGATLFPVTFF